MNCGGGLSGSGPMAGTPGTGMVFIANPPNPMTEYQGHAVLEKLDRIIALLERLASSGKE